MCDDKSVKSCKCNKRFNDSIGHEIKVLNQVLQRKLIYSAKDKDSYARLDYCISL